MARKHSTFFYAMSYHVNLQELLGKLLLILAGAPFIIRKGKATELPTNLQEQLGLLMCPRFGKGLYQVLLSTLSLRNSVMLLHCLCCISITVERNSLVYHLKKKKKVKTHVNCRLQLHVYINTIVTHLCKAFHFILVLLFQHYSHTRIHKDYLVIVFLLLFSIHLESH